MAKENHGSNQNNQQEKDLTTLDFEYQAALESAGKDKVYGFWGALWKVWNRFMPERIPHSVNKRTYLILLFLTGWFGGHRYYERRWKLGILYTAFFWTGVPLAMCLIDAMIVIPVKKDSDGMITI